MGVVLTAPPSPAPHGDLITQLGCVRAQRYLHYQPSASGVCVRRAAVLPDENLIFGGVKSRKAGLELRRACRLPFDLALSSASKRRFNQSFFGGIFYFESGSAAHMVGVVQSCSSGMFSCIASMCRVVSPRS